jgi:Mrp family chromosome partitioning ATPase
MADSASLARLSDGVLVVVREGFTRRKVLNKALDSIEKSKLLGTVLNQASMLNIDYDRYYGGSNSDSSKSLKKEAKKQAKKDAENAKAASA